MNPFWRSTECFTTELCTAQFAKRADLMVIVLSTNKHSHTRTHTRGPRESVELLDIPTTSIVVTVPRAFVSVQTYPMYTLNMYNSLHIGCVSIKPLREREREADWVKFTQKWERAEKCHGWLFLQAWRLTEIHRDIDGREMRKVKMFLGCLLPKPALLNLQRCTGSQMIEKNVPVWNTRILHRTF